MIPVTYPSSVSTSKESQMVVFALTNVTGLQRWTDYIPVKLQSTGADTANSFNTNGYLACDFLQTTTGRQAWIDYIPVFVDNAATVPWQVSDTGFIPFNTLAGGGIYYSGPTLDLNFVGSLSNPLFSSAGQDYSLNTNFLSLFYQVEAQYSVLGTNGVEQKNFTDIVTFTRASTATYFNSAGTLTTAAINEARFDYNPSTLAAQGLLIEEQRTNSIRNNTMQGAVAGTPGTLPTNWATFTALTGLTQSVVGTGTENGITYIDVRLNGTPSGAGQWQISPETTTQIVASSGQTWTSSIYYKLAAGSLTGISTTILAVAEYTAAGVYLDGSFPTLTAPSGTLQRGVATRTLNNASTARVLETLFLNLTGAAIDITLRIGLPQLEQGAFATSVIPTTTTALTRSTDVASVNTLSPWYNATEGTIYTEFVIGSTAPTTGFPTASAFTDNTTNNRIVAAYLTNATDTLDYFVSDGGATQALLSTGAYSAGAVAKMASAYAANDFAVCRGGGAVGTDTSGTVPTINVLHLGNQISGNQLGGYLRRITYYPRRLPNADLQTITA